MSSYRGDRRREGRGTDRRRAPRVGARLEARVSVGVELLDADAPAGDDPRLELFGYTRDLSEGGLGLVVPLVRFDPRSCAEGRPLLITLDPAGSPVELEAEAVRCGPLRGAGSDLFFVGAKLGGLGEREREVVRGLIGR